MKIKSLIAAGFVFAAIVSAPAKAEVVTYALTFADPDGTGPLTGGTGLITLNLPTPPGILPGSVSIFPGSTNAGSGNSNYDASDFVSLTATIDGLSFSFTQIGNSAGQLNGLAFQNGILTNIGTSGGGVDSTGKETLAINGAPGSASNGDVQIQGTNGGTINFGDYYTVGSPMVAAVPEPSTWAMMILGFCGVGFMAYRRKKNGPALSVA
jgi:xanthine/uracil/vitamin C permease (AzgA family)